MARHTKQTSHRLGLAVPLDKLRRFRRHAIWSLALPLVSLCLSPVARANLDQSQPVNLPSQPLNKTVIAIGQQFDVSIIFPSQLLAGRTAPEVCGDHQARELIESLITDMNLAVKILSPRVVAIVPKLQKREASEEFVPTFYEEITVQGEAITGSRVPNSAYNSSAPIDIITAPELSNSGAQTLVEFLKFTPAVAGNSTSTTVSNGGDGTASVTLRGLPANNTLVLVDGRRVAYNGLAGSSVDLNTIAPIAVERIDILTDGASAIYGSDAIAGVVNIITKREHDGVTIEQYYGISSRSDLETTTTNLLANKSLERGNLLFSGSVYEQDGLYSRERDFSETADARTQGGADLRSSSTPDARITLSSGEVVTLRDGATGESADDFRSATDEDLYNYNERTSSTSPSERKNLMLSLDYDLTDDLTLFTNASYASTDSMITLAPQPLPTAREVPAATVSASNIYNPFGEDIIDVRKRLMELGNREQTDQTKTYRYNASLDGVFADFHWQAYGFWSRSESRETLSGLADLDRVRRALGPAENCQGIAIDGCEPLNLFGQTGAISQAQVDYIATSEITEGTSDTRGLGFELDGRGITLPGGDSQWVGGAEWRREKTNVRAHSSTGADAFVTGTGALDVKGSRSIAELFFEWHLPLISDHPLAYSVDVELAARYSQYSDFGDNTAPKIGLRYRPSADILIRASWGQGFRAPSLDELHVEGAESQSFLVDPCSNASNVGTLPGCGQQSDPSQIQFLTVFTGDEDLKPEQSTNTTLGLAWTPNAVPGLSLSIDWFAIDQTDIIASDPQAIVNQNAFDNRFSDLVIRNDDGDIVQIFAPAINLGTREVTGVDFALQYLFNWETIGSFALSTNAVNLRKYQQRVDKDAPAIDYAGTFTDSSSQGAGPLPKWKASTGLEWTRKQWQVNYSVNYIDSMQEELFGLVSRKISSWTTHNLQANYKFNKQLQITLGIDNLFDQAPPFVATSLTDNFDGFAYNPRQQYWYLRVGYQI